MRTIKRECLDRMILVGGRHVRYVIEQYVEHCNDERPHRGRDYCRPADTGPPPTAQTGEVKGRQRLGGLLKSCYREAA